MPSPVWRASTTSFRGPRQDELHFKGMGDFLGGTAAARRAPAVAVFDGPRVQMPHFHSGSHYIDGAGASGVARCPAGSVQAVQVEVPNVRSVVGTHLLIRGRRASLGVVQKMQHILNT